MGKTWRLGTRGSELARTQSQHVADALAAATGDAVELVIIRTKGDAITDRPLHLVGGKGLFTKEIEDAMLAGDVDLAVHSMKDMPTESPAGLMIAGIPARVDPRDALVGARLGELAQGAVVGTGSARRRMQLLAARPDLDVRGIRGNVDTRVRKQRDGEYDAIVLAAAGLTRLGRAGDVSEFLAVDQMIPAPGQGALAIQCRESDAAARGAIGRLDDADTRICVEAERAFLIALEGGCSVPAACHAVRDGDALLVRGFFGADDGRSAADTRRGSVAEAAAMGRDLAESLRAAL